jgi:hypothetical protein
MPETIRQRSAQTSRAQDSSPRPMSLIRIAGYCFILLVLLLAGLLFFFRYVGLPEKVGERISQELEQRGIWAHYDRLYLSPLGGVVAKKLVIKQSLGGVTKTLNVEDLRFGFNWISWWRGESFLDHARLDGANLTIPLDQETSIHLMNVTARVEFKANNITLKNFEADLLKLHFKLKGTVHLEGYTPGKGNEMNLAKYAETWRKIEKYGAEIEGGRPLLLDAHFDLYLAQPSQSRVSAQLSGTRQSWRGVLVDQLQLEAEFLEQRLALNGYLHFLRGGLQLDANWKTDQPKAVAHFYSDADLSLFATAFPEKPQEVLADLQFRSLPINEGTLELDWKEGFTWLLQTRSDWKNFSIQDSYFNSLYCPISYNGKKAMISEMVVVNASGRSTLSAFYDGEKVFKAKLRSNIDPTSFKKLFGPKAQPFFNSLAFKQAPMVDCSITGEGLEPSTMKIKGELLAADFSYKGVPLSEVKTSFHFQDQELHLPDLRVKRPEGEGQGEVWHNLATKQVRLKGVKGRLMLREVATIIGEKMHQYAQPYGFYAAPDFQMEGVVDLDKQEKTDLKASIKSEAGLEYVFLGKKLSLKKLDADLTIKGKNLKFTPRKPIQLFEGELEGNITVQLIPDATYQAKLKVKDQQFGQLMKTFFSNEDVSGKITGVLEVEGAFSHLGTINGWGDFTVTKGFLYNIPMFGGFSDVLNSIVPNLGYSEASQAIAGFTIQNGQINIQKVDVFSTAFALIGNGTYDMVKDDVKMNMRVNLRGVLGIPFFLVSKLFEYEGKGSMSDTKWSPKSF